MDRYDIQIDREKNEVVIRRMDGDTPLEIYRPVDLSKGSVWLSAIIHGFQPPRNLICLDKPTG